MPMNSLSCILKICEPEMCQPPRHAANVCVRCPAHLAVVAGHRHLLRTEPTVAGDGETAVASHGDAAPPVVLHDALRRAGLASVQERGRSQ